MGEKWIKVLYASYDYVEGLKQIACDARKIVEGEGAFSQEDLILLDARWLLEGYRTLWFPSINDEKYIKELCPDIVLFDADDFERLVQVIFFLVDQRHFDLTPASHDGGIDLTFSEVIDPTYNAYHHIVVQCKLYRGYVPTNEIRDFFGVMTAKTATGIFVTTGEITNGGREFVVLGNSSPHSNRYHVVTGKEFQQLFDISERILANIEAAIDESDDDKELGRLAEQNEELRAQGKKIIYRRESQLYQLKLF